MCVCVCVQAMVVLGMLFAVIIYRLAVVTALYHVANQTAKTHARLITSVTASLINLVVCVIMSKVLRYSSVNLIFFFAIRSNFNKLKTPDQFILFTVLLVHLIMRISPHHSQHLRSHHFITLSPIGLSLQT